MTLRLPGPARLPFLSPLIRPTVATCFTTPPVFQLIGSGTTSSQELPRFRYIPTSLTRPALGGPGIEVFEADAPVPPSGAFEIIAAITFWPTPACFRAITSSAPREY